MLACRLNPMLRSRSPTIVRLARCPRSTSASERLRTLRLTHRSGDSGVAARGVLDERPEIVDQLRVLDDLRRASTARAPDPIRGSELLVVEISDPGSDRLVRQSSHAMHGLDSAASDRAGLGRRPDPPQPLVKE